ncbi:MAG TPA: CopG family transcriptional regulator [Rhizomicrobium sp.]|jgi:predicted transcriptional regulator|nr:CopG family transcriptional regulator [Rhizomicrobium sp.]
MRTLIDIPERDLRELERLAGQRKQSRAAVVREAITSFLSKQDAPSDAFGLWRGRKGDALAQQRKLRGEW